MCLSVWWRKAPTNTNNGVQHLNICSGRKRCAQCTMHFNAWDRILLKSSHVNVSVLCCFFYNPQLFQKFNLFVFTDGFQLLCYGLYMGKRTREQKWKEEKKIKKKRTKSANEKKCFISNGKRENEIQDKIVLPLVMWNMNICATVCFCLLSFRLCSCFHPPSRNDSATEQ